MALLFSILKVIGMVLLIIVIILAVIIACLLFIPVCYEASGDISAGNYRVRVHWFLRAFQFLFYRRDGTNEMELRLFWRRSHLLDAEYREKRKQKKAEKAAKKQSRKKKKKQHLFRKKREKLQKKIDLDTESVQNTPVQRLSEEEKTISEQKTEAEENVLNQNQDIVSQAKTQHNETISRDVVSEKDKLIMSEDVEKSEGMDDTSKQGSALDIDDKDSSPDKHINVDKKHVGKSITTKNKQHTLKPNDTEDSTEHNETGGKLKGILKKVKTAWSLMQTWHPLAMIWPPLQKLLYRIRPRMLKADLIFGFADPSVTGKVLGAVSNLYFLYYYEEFHLQGDFETEDMYIDGSFMIHGKIRGIYLLVFVIRLLSKKDFRKFLGAIKKSKNGGN